MADAEKRKRRRLIVDVLLDYSNELELIEEVSKVAGTRQAKRNLFRSCSFSEQSETDDLPSMRVTESL